MWYIYIYNGILLSHKNEWIYALCRDVGRPRDRNIEWRKSERVKQILHYIAYMWTLEKWHRRTYLHSRNKDTDVENRCMDTWGGSRGDELEDWNWHIYTIDTTILQGGQTVNPKGNQPWIFSERTDAKAELPIPEAKSEFIGKNLNAGKDRRQEEKGVTEDRMVGWHHWLDGLEFEQAPGDSKGQRNLACCSPWGRKELDTTERLNNNTTQIFRGNSSVV